MIFQSLASNYTFKGALNHLCAHGTEEDFSNLKKWLSKHYGGYEVELYSRGRAALSEAIRVVTGGEGRVVVTGLTCYSVEQAVLSSGCVPVFADITYKDLQYGEQELDTAAGEEPVKAIVVQNTLGIPADILAIQHWAKQHKVPIIEDLAHCTGSHYTNGKEMGTVGDAVMLSFGRGKSIDVVNGGALIVRKKNLTTKARIPRITSSLADRVRDRVYPLFGVIARYTYGIWLGKAVIAIFYKLHWAIRSADGDVNINEKLTNWQAKLAYEKLTKLDKTVTSRRQFAKKVMKLTKLSPIESATNENASLVRVPFVVQNRYEVLQALKKAGVYFEDVWYDTPVSPRRYFNRSSFNKDMAPGAVKIANELINIPTSSDIKTSDLHKIAAIINEVGKDAER